MPNINSYRISTETRIPSSAVLLASIRVNGEHYDILIVSDDAQQCSDNGIYWKGRTLSKFVLDAHFSGNNKFTLKETEYIIDSVKKYSKYSAAQREWQKHNTPNSKELYVFKQKGIYDNSNEGYELVNAAMYFPKKMQSITVPVYYKESEAKYFMNEESFVPLIKANGWPNVNLHFSDDSHGGTCWTSSLNEQSKLKMLGYSVQQANGMTDGERQSLLRTIIESELMTDAEIANHLEMLLHLNAGKPNFANACSYWRQDLEYVQTNFGDMRRQTCFYGTDGRATSSGSRNRTHIENNKPRNVTASERRTTQPARNTAQINMKNALMKRRTDLYNDLQEAAGLFNVFKRKHIRREISEIESELNKLG